MKDRIFKVMKWTGLNLSQFADAISVSPALLSSVKSERTKPTLLLVENIKKVYPEIDINWLIMGAGEMLVGSSPSGLHVLANDTSSSTVNVAEQVAAATQESASDPEKVPNPVITSQPSAQNADESLSQVADVQQPPVVTETPAKSVKHLLLLFNDGTYETYEKSK